MSETHNSITGGPDPPTNVTDQHQYLDRTVDLSCYGPFTSCSDPSQGLGAQDSNNFDMWFDSLASIDTVQDDAWTPLKFSSQEEELQQQNVCDSMPDRSNAVVDQDGLISRPKKSKKRKEDNHDVSSVVSAALSLSSTSSSGSDYGDEEVEEVEFSSRLVEFDSRYKSEHDGGLQEPICGMQFCSEEEAYNFYKNYGKRIGFNVRKGKVQRSRNGNITKRYIFCSREGFRSETQSKKTTTYKRKATRTGCEAKIIVALSDTGTWKITKLLRDHNHQLAKTSEDHLMVHMEEEEEEEEDEMGKDTGATKCPESCDMYWRGISSNNKGNSLKTDEVQGLIDYFRHLQVEDPSFFYTVQFDGNGRVKSFFWRDGRSRIDYDYFGDVLILDATFRINKYGMICAPYLGVNHHRQFILFGCALLLDEGTDSFVWLFKSFAEAMCRKQPKTVFTEEGQGMAEAVRAALPNAKHLLAKWNIRKNAQRHLSAYLVQPGFKTLFDECIFGCRTEDQLKSKWNCLLKRFALQPNPWLNTLYLSREMWSNVHSGNSFTAGVESNDRIKTIFQNLSIETECSLQYFVQQYSHAAEQLRREEFNEDFCNRTIPEMILHNAVEKQAASTYTSTMFKIFQRELLNCLSVAIEEIARDESSSTFKLIEEGEKESVVKFSFSDSSISCTCKKYESLGILCVHALKVLNAKNIFHIPPQYIMKRWTKSAKDSLQADDHESRVPDKTKSPANLLMRKALNVIIKSATVKESREVVEEYLDMALKRVDDILKHESTGHQTAEVEAHSEQNYGLSDAPKEARKAISEPAWSNDFGKGHSTSSFLSQMDCGIDISGDNGNKGRNGELEVDSGRTISRACKDLDNRLIQKECRISNNQLGSQGNSSSQQNNLSRSPKQNLRLSNEWKLHPRHLDVLFHKRKASEMEQQNFKLMAENLKLLTEQNKLQKELLEARKGEKYVVDRAGGSSTSRNNSFDT